MSFRLFFLEENTFEWVFHEGSILSQYFNSHFQSFVPSFPHTNAHMLFVKGEVKDGKNAATKIPAAVGAFDNQKAIQKPLSG